VVEASIESKGEQIKAVTGKGRDGLSFIDTALMLLQREKLNNFGAQ
jgi:hypothetical protein